MTQNWEVFSRDPRGWRIPNDGVTKVGEPNSAQAWDVLRYELTTFVCEGQYEMGLTRILSSYLTNLSRGTQPAVWVSGFYGSGKSHLVRVLEYLWRDIDFPDGTKARSLVTLPPEIEALLRELSAAGKREGGLWAAAGTLGSSAGESVRLAVCGIMFNSAGLPERYPLGKFCLWLHEQGIFEAVRTAIEAQGASFDEELSNLYVSPLIPQAILAAYPAFAADESEAKASIRAQFVIVPDIGDEEMLETLEAVMRLKSSDGRKLPCTLLILDELQQYLGENTERTLQVQNIVESCSKRFGSQVLVIATGQSAIQGTVQLAKLQGRFTLRIELTDTDVEKVLRQVVLRKAPDKEPLVRAALENASGEIDRQLHGTRIAPNAQDRPLLSADYPLLPARRRFWERVLVAVDKAGSAGQLRAQLRIVHETLQGVADADLGTVVPGDAIYAQLSADMITQGVLPREIDQTIRTLDDGSAEGALRSRLCALAFLVDQLPVEGLEVSGVRPTTTTFVDLLVKDLGRDTTTLRARVPASLEWLSDNGILMQTFGDDGQAEFRVQTTESREWEQAYRAVRTQTLADDGALATMRTQALRSAVEAELKRLSVTQGVKSKTPRGTALSFAAEAPKGGEEITIWVRDEWATDERSVKADAAQAGADDAGVYVFLPKRRADDLRASLAGARAAGEVIDAQGQPNTAEGINARNAMLSRQQQHELSVKQIITDVIAGAQVFQGGGTEVTASSFKEAVQSAAERAAVRLYRDFVDEDPRAWGKVVTRARQRNPDPLSALPYQGETRDHPVVSQVLALVGSGKRGNDVRNHFSGVPYGWPKEAIEGSLLALVVADQLSASFNGSPASAESLDSGTLGKSEFRSVNTVITTVQRIKIRGLLAQLGITAKTNEEAVAAPQFVAALTALAQRAGGEAPAPAAPNPSYFETLRTATGNDLLMALFGQAERIGNDMKTWQEAEAQLAERLPRWQTLTRLLAHAPGLEAGETFVQQAGAIREERTLLNDPDPVPPLLQELASKLRERFTTTFKDYQAAYYRALQDLTAQTVWQDLPEQDASLILRQHSLTEPKLPDVSTETRLLEAYSRHPLDTLATAVAALPTRAGAALTDAAKLLEPKAVEVRFPKETLKTEADAERYVEALKAEILRNIREGRPVIL